MKHKSFGLAVIILFCLGVWWWARSSPWAKAKRALERAQPGQAVEVLVDALESKTWSPEREEALRELLIKGYLAKGAIDPAEQELRALQEKFPKNAEAPLGLGILNLTRGRWAFAVDDFETAKRLDPKDVRPYWLLGRIFADRRDYKRSASNLAAGLVRFPEDERLMELSADLLFNQGQYQVALSMYHPLMGSSPKDRTLRLKVARCFLASGELDKASKILTEFRPSSGKDEGLELLLAQILWDQGKRTVAETAVERLYREDNRYVTAGMTWAIFLAARERLGEADKVLSPIGENLLPLGGGVSAPFAGQTFDDLDRLQSMREAALREQISYLHARAVLAESAGRYVEATGHLERALNLDDGDFGTISEMAELSRLKNEPAARLKWANRAVSLYKNHPAALLLRAQVLLDMHRTQDAIFDTRAVANDYPRLALAQALLSRAWMMQKNPLAALESAEKAVSLNSGDKNALLALAMARSALGRDRDADMSFRSAIEIDPRFAEARYRWGIHLKAEGRLQESKVQLEEAARVEPLVYKLPR